MVVDCVPGSTLMVSRLSGAATTAFESAEVICSASVSTVTEVFLPPQADSIRNVTRMEKVRSFMGAKIVRK